MGRCVGIVVGVLAAFAVPALADEPPAPVDSPQAPPTTPPPISAGPIAPVEPHATVVVHPVQSDGFTVERHGVMLLGGFQFANGERTQYGVLYIPLPVTRAPRLKLGITGSLEYHRAFVPDGDDLIATAYYIEAFPQYDWRLPIPSSKGDFAIAVEGGFGVGQIWLRWPEAPYMPPGWEHVTGMSIHGDVAFQFFAHNGFVASVQPVGITKPIFVSELPSAYWSKNYDAVYAFAIGAGFRWR